MKVELRIIAKEGETSSPPKRGRPPKPKEIVRYMPAIIDASRIEFAWVDEDNDINIRYYGCEDFYTIKNAEGLLDKINAIIDKRFPEVRGLR